MEKSTGLVYSKRLNRWVVYRRGGGYDLWSRVVYQNFVLGGAPIPKGVIVHHRDEDPTNDTPENLEGTTRKQHPPIHRTGTNHSEETKKKIGDGNRGKERSWKTLEKLSKSHRGKTRSPESIEKQRATMTGRKQDPEHTEKVRQANLGKKRTPEQCEKNRQARLGKPLSPETRKKISDALKCKPDKKEDQVS